MVPDLESPSPVARNGVDGCVAVLSRPVLGIGIKVEEDVVDIVIDIDHVFGLFVDGVTRDVAIEKTDHGIPERPGRQDIGIDFPILGPASKMTGIPVVLKALGQVVNSEIEAVDIEVNVVAVS